MSDLFGPMPLPDRPVPQFADIAEREAIAKQKEIDTRMRERLETSRVQSIHEIGVAKEEYRTTLQQLEQDFKKEAMRARSIKSYASGISSRSKRVSLASSRGTEDDRRNEVSREKVRLAIQYHGLEIDLAKMLRELPREAMENGWNKAQLADAAQERASQRLGTQVFSQDSYFATQNEKYMLKTIEAVSDWTIAVTKDFNERKDNSDIATNWRNNKENIRTKLFYIGRADQDEISFDTNIHELSDWKDLKKLAGDPEVAHLWSPLAKREDDLLKGSAVGGDVQRALVNVVGGLVSVQAMTAITGVRGDLTRTFAHMSDQDHVEQAIANALASPLYESIEEYFENDAQFQKQLRGDLTGRMAKALQNQEMHDKRNLLQLYIDDTKGLNDGMDVETRIYTLLSFGVPFEEAIKEGQKWGVKQEEKTLEMNEAISAELEAKREENRAEYVSSLRTAIQNHPELFPNSEDTRLALLRMEGQTGPLRPGDGEELFNKYIAGAEKDLLAMYPGLDGQVNDFVDQINADENTKDNQGLPVFLDKERGMTADQFGEDTVEWYQDLILNPQDGKRPTLEAVQELLDRRLNVFASRLELKKKTQTNLGVMTRSPGGEARGTGMAFRIQPLAGAREVHSDRLLTQLDVSEEVRDQFESLPLEERGRFAVRQIQFDRGFDGTETDDEVEIEVRSRLAHLQQNGGPVRRYSVDRAGRTAYVQLVHNGETHAILLDDAEAGKTLEDLGNLMIEARVTLEETSQALLAHGASLFYVHTDPSTGEVSEHKTALVDVLMQKGERALNTLLRFIRHSGLSGSRNFWGARYWS